MAAERSFFTEIAQELRSEIREIRREASASPAAVSFGMERVRRRTFMQRYEAMSDEQRGAWLKKVGHEQAIAMLRSN